MDFGSYGSLELAVLVRMLRNLQDASFCLPRIDRPKHERDKQTELVQSYSVQYKGQFKTSHEKVAVLVPLEQLDGEKSLRIAN